MPPHPSKPQATTAADIARTAGDIVKSFNTWAYKREQPSDLDLLHQTIAARVAANRPIEFVLYWGKGRRSHSAEPDRQCLDFLAGFGQRISDTYAGGVRLTLLQTDTHATLNNHSAAAIECYFTEIAQAAAVRGLDTRRLSTVVATLPLDEYPPPLDDIPERMLEQLIQCATKWYGGPADAATGARQYLAMNMIEKRAVERAYPGSVFITFNGRDFRALFPDTLPIFYMCSLKKGTAVKPWFLPDATENPAPARLPFPTHADLRL